MPVKGKPQGRAPKNQHKLCKPLPNGEILTDLRKKTWKLGDPLGSGGFGLIYTAIEDSKSSNNSYVIKVEPHGNGPLFSEIAFYQKAARIEQIEEWQKRKRLSYLPIPAYIAHGLHTCGKESLRFLVMPRFGLDLHQLWLNANKKFKRETVAKIGIMMIDALEYIHDKEYVHADIKGANILCDLHNSNQLYLVDYGLASRYAVNGEHKKYKADPRKAHDGTIEYTSVDAHNGASPSRRGDIEILGLYLLHLIAGHLPWEDKLSDCKYVSEQKKHFLKDPDKHVKSACGALVPEISKHLKIATSLEYDEEPDYGEIKNLYKSVLKSLKVSLNSSLDFSSNNTSVSSDNDSSSIKRNKVKAQKRKIAAAGQIKRKARKQAIVSSDDLASSSEDGSSQAASSSQAKKEGPRQDTVVSSCSDENSPVGIRRKANVRKKKNLIGVESEDFETDSSQDLNSSKNSRLPMKNASKFNASTPKNAKPVQSKKHKIVHADKIRIVNGEILPKPSKPPIFDKVDTRQNKSKKLIKSSARKIKSDLNNDKTDSDDDESVDPFKVNHSRMKTPDKRLNSRYSMAPLHTEPVLTKTDKLTGKYSGKHPVFVRKKRKNVVQNDATTQTTPSLRSRQSKK